MLRISQLTGFNAGGAEPITATSVDWRVSGTNVSSPITFTTVSYGGTGRIAIAISGICGGAISGVTVDGVAATQIANTFGGLRGAAIYVADVETTSGTIVVSISGSFNTITMDVYAIGKGTTTQFYAANSAGSYGTTFNIPEGSAVVACSTQNGGTSTPSCTWTGVTADNTSTIATSFNTATAAHANYQDAVESQTVSAAWSAGSLGAAAFAVFSP